ncbi:MAG: MalY/PatB family protein [Asticcacaulis sp.]
MEQNIKTGHDRRSFLRNAGLSGGVLALGPLAASLASGSEVSAAPMGGKYDFDTPYNRLGFDDVKWDGAVRTEHMSHIVAGMGIADMDFKCAPVITEALRKRIQHENWGYMDMASPGPVAFKEGLINWNKKRYGITAMTMENMGITTGVHAGIMATLRAYAPPGSKVLMATPIYNGFYYDIMGSKLVANESLMHYANGRYEIDWDDLERRMTPDTKVTILCNPQNPVGRAWTKEELTRYGELCLKHNVKVLSDEIHCDFITKGNKYTPFSTLDDKKIVANSITFKSGSKSFSLPAMKCAWFFTTNPEMHKEVSFWNRADLSTLGMIAEQAAYAGGEAWLNECVDYIDGNQQFANDYIKKSIPMIKVGNKPEGTYLTWLDVSAVADKIGAQKLADEENKKPQPISMLTNKPTVVTPEDMVSHWFAKNANVAIELGATFGKGGLNHLRMNTATSRTTLKAALDSVETALKRLA